MQTEVHEKGQAKIHVPIVKLFVKPTPRDSVQGRDKQELTTVRDGQIVQGRRMGKTKAMHPSGETCPDELIFRTDKSRIRLMAGMTQAIENPFFEVDPNLIKMQYSLSDNWRSLVDDIVKSELITIQRKLEIMAGVEPDTYTEDIRKRKKIGPFFDPKDPGSVLHQFRFRLYDRTNVVTSNTPRGRLAIQLIKNRPDMIAPNFNMINIGKHNWYIAKEDEELIATQRLNEKVNEAIFQLVTLQRQYPDHKMYQVATMLDYFDGNRLVKGEMSPMTVDQSLNDYIKNPGQYQRANVQRFLDTMETFNNNPELFHVRYVVQEASNKNIVSENNGYVFWHSKKNTPEHYKYTTRKALEDFLFTQMDQYDPDEPNKLNLYAEMLKELKAKGVEIKT